MLEKLTDELMDNAEKTNLVQKKVSRPKLPCMFDSCESDSKELAQKEGIVEKSEEKKEAVVEKIEEKKEELPKVDEDI